MAINGWSRQVDVTKFEAFWYDFLAQWVPQQEHGMVAAVGVTCPTDENIADARLRKEVRHTPLKHQMMEHE